MDIQSKIQELLERENLHLAPIPMRALAWFIDMLLLGIVFTFLEGNSIAHLSDSQGNINYAAMREFMADAVYQVWALKIGYDTIFIWRNGASVGKMLCKIRVVSLDLVDNPSFTASLLRAVGKYLGESLLFITYVFGVSDMFYRTLHDRLAKTLVITCS